MPPVIVLYTRQTCPLCDEAKVVLREHDLPFEEVDIDQRTEFLEAYDHWVPVVEMDGEVRFRGRIDPRLLKRLLRGSA